MKVSIQGVRGSIPTSGSETAYFGGNTSCVTVMEEEWMIILDAGSGLQKVKLPDPSTKRVDILLTHFHMDHIQGLGFFSPLFDPDKEVHIWAPSSLTQGLLSRLNKFLSPPLFPVLMRDLPCKLVLHDISNSSFEIGPFSLNSEFVIHPGATVGFRIKGKSGVFAFIPDHEPALGLKGMIPDKKWVSGYELIEKADLLVHDGQFTIDEYVKKIGWGHSSMEDTIQLAEFAGVKKLLMTHHDPAHTDSKLQEMFTELKSKNTGNLDFGFAVEGMEIEVGY
ncbi:MBL fold metallo-hydrolase [Aquiflexum sp. TKW24L]|uniref:MBL fold metallo-hydrolase n=1 Tax=Aquiflexum sp. TKW24L TaxID=2942212 RepID=UPI0020C112AB|nr:MBL fold metallo-hydrolase [Aquiflexum sp. TKW24L]MCL6257914.1 MBL fold metallo-hydrolase [Aquiflexum sp. TKW24L]